MSGKLRLVLAVSAVLAALTPATAAAATPEYFPLPESRGMNIGMVADPSGNVWFGAKHRHLHRPPELARLTPTLSAPGTSNGIAYFQTPKAVGEGCCAFDPRRRLRPRQTADLVHPQHGRERLRKTGEMSPGTASGIQVAITPGAPNLGGIAVAPGGTAWFTETRPATSRPTMRATGSRPRTAAWSSPSIRTSGTRPAAENSSRYDARPDGVTIGKDGAPWFVEDTPGIPGYRLAKVAGGQYEEYQVKPCEPSRRPARARTPGPACSASPPPPTGRSGSPTCSRTALAGSTP